MPWAQKIITWSFYILFFFTPLFFTPFNNELFEYNKMMLVYGLTIIIVGSWLLKIINHKSLIFNHTPLTLPLLLFWFSQFLSTILSIDPHTSIWGYYSRSNGGLLSITAYILLYFALISNFTSEAVPKFLKAAVFGGVIVSLYAIPEHFGVSPSCIILTGSATANCWVQDVQARVFATLGQPNWLAAYLAMVIFPALYFFIQAKTKTQSIIYYLLLTIYYLAFTFTYSRGGTLGFLAGLGIFTAVVIGSRLSVVGKKLTGFQLSGKNIFIVILTFIVINLIFGSALNRFKLWGPGSTIPKAESKPAASSGGVTQLENGGTESSQIRFIVWKGGIDVFKHYPVFGSGVETFAYSYYNFRPKEHNTVSEWDFLYNKAHNEYLNYLATTGLVGFISYLTIIFAFIFWCISRILNFKLQITNYKLQIRNHKTKLNPSQTLFLLALLAGYISYLVQNFFGFSVVIIALFFYLFPALAFIETGQNREINFKTLPKNPLFNFLVNLKSKMAENLPVKITITLIWALALIYHILLLIILRVYFPVVFALLFFALFLPKKFNLRKLTIFIVMLSLLLQLSIYYFADMFYKKGSDSGELGNAGSSYNNLSVAANLNNNEPLYHADLAFAAASASISLMPDDATTAAKLKKEAIEEINTALSIGPKNVSLWRTAIRTYYALAQADPTLEEKTIYALDQSIALAPTDAKLYYNKGLVLSQSGKNKEGITSLEKAAELKSNYWEAHYALGTIYKETGQKDKAIEEYGKVLKILPGEPESVKQLEELKKGT